eukprot:s11222_g1.t1
MMCSSMKGVDWDDFQESIITLYRGESPMVRVRKLWGSAFVEGDEEEQRSGKGTPSTVTPSQSFGEEV